ncbi:hypothetical protein H4K35_12140 [Myroides sp. NP-2]|uniref:hypothetical protein n=1 Tax=Myroides sp. NP-2 TaxID=2759945 RepID=UPI0015FC6A98|nr:hypothetical protein [Myroides sp. NP-2]MBB1150849.1 hypothetical protein [Myroides sp. NP-2]
MTHKSNKTSIFSEDELCFLPLTYRIMECENTKDVHELRTQSWYTTSSKHFSSNYIVCNSHKPLSNFLLYDPDSI